MKFRISLILVLGAVAAMAGGKPPACTRYPATIWVATGPAAYGVTGDSAVTETIDGVTYSKYVDGQGGVEAYVNGGSCAGTFFLVLSGARKVNLVFQNMLNNGLYGPPSGTPVTTPIWQMYLRGFSFPQSANPYTTMSIINFSAVSRTWPGGGVRYEPMSTDFNTDNPDFQLYPDTNKPCETSAAEMTSTGLNTTLVAPVPQTCSAYAGPVATLLQQVKGGAGQMQNVGQYGMNFRFIIQVNGGWTRPQ